MPEQPGQESNVPQQIDPQEFERLKSVAADFEHQTQQLAAKEAAIAEEARQLEAARILHHAMSTDPDFNSAVQSAYAHAIQARQAGQQPPGQPDPGAQQQPQIPPQLIAAVQQTMGQTQQLGLKIGELEGSLREREISAQVQQLAAQYPFAEPAEVVAFVRDYPNTRIDTALAASNDHYRRKFEAVQAAQEAQREQNRRSSSLGASGMPAVSIDKTLLKTPAGRRSALDQAVAVLTGQIK